MADPIFSICRLKINHETPLGICIYSRDRHRREHVCILFDQQSPLILNLSLNQPYFQLLPKPQHEHEPQLAPYLQPGVKPRPQPGPEPQHRPSASVGLILHLNLNLNFSLNFNLPAVSTSTLVKISK